MENFCKGMTWGLVTGLIIGGVAVAKNKKLSVKIRKGLGIAEEKMQEAKEFIEEKIEDSKEDFECKTQPCGTGFDKNCDEKSNFDCLKNGMNKDLNKKSKN